MDDQNKNLILATALSFLVILVWFILFPPPEETQTQQTTTPQETSVAAAPVEGATPAASGGGTADVPIQETGERIDIDTPRLSGTFSLLGGRIDDVRLLNYREELKPDSPNVTLLSPSGGVEAYYSLFGWAPGGSLDFADVPGANTPWQLTAASATTLTTQTPVEMTWTNTKGQTFLRTLSIDDNYMLTVRQRVQNNGTSAVRLAGNNEVVHEGLPSTLTRLLVHEGAIRQSGETLKEVSYLGGFMQYEGFDSLNADPSWGPHANVVGVESNGWLGLTDRYWMTVLVPDPNQQFTAVIAYYPNSQKYKAIARYPTVEVAPGQSHEIVSRLFVGAKDWDSISSYESDLGVYRFTDSVDWGWYFFLTKPLFRLLHFLNSVIGNMGWAIIALTLIIKAILFPLAYRSYVSMAKMKELQPEMEKIKERAGDDRQKLQQEMMALYRAKKVNPASGCLPILIQIPVFFSLYKVILVSLDLRHAPWVGWIRDLSAPDPSSLLNLWGILPFSGPEPGSIMAFIFIGILPLCLGVSMWLQQKLNPAPTDPTQQMIFAWMPWVFMFMLGSFASGLVVYWIANNVITFTQQYIIMRSQGYSPDVFGNIRSSFKRKSDPK